MSTGNSPLPREEFAAQGELELGLLDLPDSAMSIVLQKLSKKDLFAAAGTCRQLSDVAELVFLEENRRQGWREPRRPRGQDAKPHRFPHRYLYLKHACSVCRKFGEFPVRLRSGMNPGTSSAAVQFLLCKACTQKDAVAQGLLEGNLFVDLIGLRGKRLLDSKDKRAHRLALDLGIEEADNGAARKRRKQTRGR